MIRLKQFMLLMAILLAACSPTLLPMTTPKPGRVVAEMSTPLPTRTPRATQIATIPRSQENNLYGIPYQSPEWLLRPQDASHPFNTLVLGTDGNCTLTINTKTDIRGVIEISEEFTLGSHTWTMLQILGDNMVQLDEIYYPDAYPPEYTEGGGVAGNGYAMTGFHESCRSSIQSILANMR